ncbi:uncharacterized protein LACBIDRAFT_335072 [Laccaria bicolor S238N-H82]|uniref:Predicted protein n=1 Tax=Laccaria bicolor (strain S238N-H82 / ATCC MYA-4686) TaxID=486041 RepID=B0E198_LACBS|nr:uncharacterized protein LACBIDRAFT_335072 [Laccaria bicolor S238N-H82]EDQ99386.1 predicted protein [Laccaria bicolor S238N-H82]|eukprot:XP_001889937.1 predicted protein [Laccaria bicolor S238N-H82]
MPFEPLSPARQWTVVARDTARAAQCNSYLTAKEAVIRKVDTSASTKKGKDANTCLHHYVATTPPNEFLAVSVNPPGLQYDGIQPPDVPSTIPMRPLTTVCFWWHTRLMVSNVKTLPEDVEEQSLSGQSPTSFLSCLDDFKLQLYGIPVWPLAENMRLSIKISQHECDLAGRAGTGARSFDILSRLGEAGAVELERI